MNVIVKRALHIAHPGGDKKQNIIVRHSPNPQRVPDWVRNTVEFGHASKDGSMVEVIVPKAAPASKTVPVASQTGLAGDDAGDGDKAKGTGKGKAAGN